MLFLSLQLSLTLNFFLYFSLYLRLSHTSPISLSPTVELPALCFPFDKTGQPNNPERSGVCLPDLLRINHPAVSEQRGYLSLRINFVVFQSSLLTA